MKDKIKWVSEAYSMQPVYFAVGNKYDGVILDNIQLEVLDEHNNIYVGYTSDNKKIFQIIAKASNVGYFN